jgi:hypothetical protein
MIHATRIANQKNTFGGYGGPAFNYQDYQGEYENGDFFTLKQLYDDVQLELSNRVGYIQERFHCRPDDLIWFQDSLDARKYTSSLTVESCWVEDVQGGIDYLGDLVGYLERLEGEPFESQEIAGLDRHSMKSIYDLLSDFDYENLGYDDWDVWGPYDWYPYGGGEWSRCRDIAHDREEYPVTLFFNGIMVDGAHRLAVAVYKHSFFYPCLVGCPERIFRS